MSKTYKQLINEIDELNESYVKLRSDKKILEKILKKHDYHYSSSDSMMFKGEHYDQYFYEHGKESTAIYLNSKIDKNGKTKHHFEVYDRDGGNLLHSSVPQENINDVAEHLENFLKKNPSLNEAYFFSVPPNIKKLLEDTHREGVEFLKTHFEKDHNPSWDDDRFDSPERSGKVGTIMKGLLPWARRGTGTEFLKHKRNPSIKLDYWVELNTHPDSPLAVPVETPVHKAILFKSGGGRLAEISHPNLNHFKEALIRAYN